MMNEAEDWANKVLKENPLNEVTDEFLEMMLFGSIGYRIDKVGNKTKLTQEELAEMKLKSENISVEQLIEKYGKM